MVYSSNSLDFLCKKLSDQLSKPLENLFQRNIIVTQTLGMEHWLKTLLAHKHGVVANVQFINPNGLIWNLQQLLLDQIPQANPHTIRFRLFSLLDGDQFKDKFPEVAEYYMNNPLKRIQLAGKLTTLLDHYQLYRPDMVEGWEEDRLSNTDFPAEKWQQWLWKNLQNESQKDISQKLMAEITKRPQEVIQNFPRISVFGLTSGNTFHLQLFKELAEVTQVQMYIQLPSVEEEFKNPLLKSLGQKSIELKNLIEEYCVSPLSFETQPVDTQTTLGKLQNQLLNDSDKEEAFEDDGSITINSCYTPIREAECLYNYLLNLFEQDKTLQPSDILVVTTQLDKYAPFLRAVFRNAPVRLPMAISGMSSNTEDSIISALDHIMRFADDDFTAERVMSLLEQQRIQQRMGIEDTVYVRQVLQKANIRFGEENCQKDDTVYVSWKYGLDKLLLGYAMYTDQEFPFDDNLTLVPYQDAEASASYDLLRLKAFVEKLQEIQSQKKGARTLSQWKEFLIEVMDDLIYFDDFNKDDRASVSDIHRSLLYIDSIEHGEEVFFEVFLEELDNNFFRDARQLKLNTGNITVTKPYAVKGIPHKVICVLGLDNGEFPRVDRYMGFDLLGQEYQDGDRSLKETDKNLFLDLILSAQQKLYISYIGKSVKNNGVIPPSIVTDSLVHYLNIPELITEQPLHGFSQQYNKDNPKLITYLYGDTSESQFVQKRKDEAPSAPKDVSIKEFLNFCKEPVKWYFNHVLDIYYDDVKEELPEHEVFELNNLEKWIVNNDIVQGKADNEEEYLLKAKKEGKLPLGISGKVVLDQLKDEVEAAKNTYSRLVNGREEKSVEIFTTINGITITGTLGGIFDRELIVYTVSGSQSTAKNKAAAYAQALLLAHTGHIDKAQFIDKKGEVTSLPIDASTVEKKLNKVISFFKEAHKELFIYSTEVFKAATGGMRVTPPETEEEARSRKINTSLWKNAYGDKYTPSSPYFIKVVTDPLFKEFGQEHIDRIIEFGNTLNL